MATDQVARNTAADARRSALDNAASFVALVGQSGTSTRVGQRALSSLWDTGVANTALGYDAGRNITWGQWNVAVGFSAQVAMTSGSYNVAVGYRAQASTETSQYNVAVGTSAQTTMTTGFENTAVGNASQGALTTGQGNTAVGSDAQYAVTEGVFNTAVGRLSQGNLTTSGSSTAVGWYAQYSLSTGENNTALGAGAGYTDGTTATTDGVDYTTLLGYNAQATRSNVAVIGSELAAERQTLCLGNYDGLGAGGLGDIALADAQTVPSVDPTGGGVLYSEAGALKWRGSSGTITTIAVA